MSMNGEIPPKPEYQLDPLDVIRVFEQMFPKELQIAMLIVRNQQLEELLKEKEKQSD